MNALSPQSRRIGLGRMLAFVGIAVALTCCGGDMVPPFNFYNAVVLGDFDGDGALDIALSGSFVSGAPPHPGFVTVIRQSREHRAHSWPGCTTRWGATPTLSQRAT